MNAVIDNIIKYIGKDEKIISVHILNAHAGCSLLQTDYDRIIKEMVDTNVIIVTNDLNGGRKQVRLTRSVLQRLEDETTHEKPVDIQQANCNIFISYRHKKQPRDETGSFHASLLEEELKKKYGEEYVFRDKANIKGGDHFPTTIKDALSKSSIVIFIIGPNWVRKRLFRKPGIFSPRDWIHIELHYAWLLGKHVLPVLADGEPMPPAATLPSTLHFITEINAIPLTEETWKQDLQTIFNRIDTWKNQPIHGPRQFALEEKKKGLPVRVNASLAFLLCIAIGPIWYFARHDNKKPDQFINGKNAIVKIVSIKEPTTRSGFFINNNGFLLSVGPNIPGDSLFEVTMPDSTKDFAKLVSYTTEGEFRMLLLKLNRKNTPFLKTLVMTPQPGRYIIVNGVPEDSDFPKEYTTWVDSVRNNMAGYRRPGDMEWKGLGGGPIIDVEKHLTVGMHLGMYYDKDYNFYDKLGIGFYFRQIKLDSLMRMIKSD